MIGGTPLRRIFLLGCGKFVEETEREGAVAQAAR